MASPGQRGGVALGVPQTRVLCPNKFQARSAAAASEAAHSRHGQHWRPTPRLPDKSEASQLESISFESPVMLAPLCRQFEYHPSLPLLAIGTVTGSVVLADWEENRYLGSCVLPPPPNAAPEAINVLALSWLRRDPTRVVAAAAHGGAAMYRVDLNRCSAQRDDERAEHMEQEEADSTRPYGSSSAQPATSSSSSAADPNALSLVHRYNAPLAPKLTSMHCNADDTLLAGSGYTYNVHISDLETGYKLRVLKNIHEGHINIARFANHMPYLLLT